MPSQVLVLNGSPKKDGNTSVLINWFLKGWGADQTQTVEIVSVANLNYYFPGCTSCRRCQTKKEYGCVIEDDA